MQIPAQPFAYDFDVAHTALVIIDMQRDFIEPGGFGETLGNDVSLLSAIVRLGPLRAVELAHTMHMSASTLSRNLRPLIDAGWVEQASGPDARSWFIQATAAGQGKRTEAQKRWRVAQESLNQALGVEQVMALHALIDTSMATLEMGDTDDHT